MIIYEGISRIDGNPVVAIATGIRKQSQNAKTGDMVQTWIMRQDIAPNQATKSGEDVSICGSCMHRPAVGGACYVNVARAPLSVWKTYRSGFYPAINLSVFANRKVRIGAYGDPAAIPIAVWHGITRHAAGWTGYTHMWRDNPQLQRYCMASVDSIEEYREAHALGWRTFRVKRPNDETAKNEAVCPASDEAGKLLNCADCLACDGTRRNLKGSIVINVHGSKKRGFINAFNKSD